MAMNLKSSQQIIQLESFIAETALVAMIQHEPAEIGRIHRLEFKESYDSLDYLVYAVLPLSLGNQVALVRHKHSPDPGTEICVRHNQKDIARVISEALYALGLDRNAITWILPEYEKQLYDLLEEQDEQKSSLLGKSG
jgi:hypothetical protein